MVAILYILIIFYWPLLAARNVANGGSGKIDFGNSSAFNILGDLTVGIWIKLAKAPAQSISIINSKAGSTLSGEVELRVATSNIYNFASVEYLLNSFRRLGIARIPP